RVARVPPSVSSTDPGLQTSDSEPAEVLLDAPDVSVAAIDESPFGRSGDEERAELVLRLREIDDSLGCEVVKVAHECLELGYHSKNVRVADWAPDLERTTRPVDLAHGGVRRGERGDCFWALLQPL